MAEGSFSGTAAADRDQEIGALFDRHYRDLRGLAYVMIGDAAAAEEVTMEAFVKAFSGWSRFRKVEHRHAYLRQIVVNLCRSRARRKSLELRTNALLHRSGESSPSDFDVDRHSLHLDVRAAVRRLPPRQRACVVLRYVEDLSESQIADVLGCSVGTVKSQLFKARAKIERSIAATLTGGEHD